MRRSPRRRRGPARSRVGAAVRGQPPDRPVIFTVDDEPEALSRVEGELRRRFGADYRIVCSDSAEDALATLDALLAEGAEVAVVLADQWMPGTTDLAANGRVPGRLQAR